MNVIAFSKFDFLAGNVKRLLFHNEICLITLNRFTKKTFVIISSTNVNSVASDFSKNAITNRICFHMKPPMAQSNIFFHRLPSSDSAKVNKYHQTPDQCNNTHRNSTLWYSLHFLAKNTEIN